MCKKRPARGQGQSAEFLIWSLPGGPCDSRFRANVPHNDGGQGRHPGQKIIGLTIRPPRCKISAEQQKLHPVLPLKRGVGKGHGQVKMSSILFKETKERHMPLYEYLCKSCGHTFEALCSLDAASQRCPKCGKEKTERVLSVTAPNPKARKQGCPGPTEGSPCMTGGMGCCRGCQGN